MTRAPYTLGDRSNYGFAQSRWQVMFTCRCNRTPVMPSLPPLRRGFQSKASRRKRPHQSLLFLEASFQWKRRSYLYVNNRMEGCAPLTIEGMMLGGETVSFSIEL